MIWLGIVVFLVILGIAWDHATPGGDTDKPTKQEIEAERKSVEQHKITMNRIRECADPELRQGKPRR